MAFICLTVHDCVALALVIRTVYQHPQLCLGLPLLHHYNCLQYSDRPDCSVHRVEGVSLEEQHVLQDTNVKEMNRQKLGMHLDSMAANV